MASRVTLKDIAREANVSVGLASKALSRYPEVSEDMQRRIQRISKRLGYRPRRRRITPNEAAASAPRPRRVCLTFLDGRSAASAYTRHWVRELSLAAGRQDMRLEVVVIESDDAPSCGDELRRCAEDVDGMLLLGFIRTGIGSIIRDIGKSCLAIGDFEPGPRPVTHQVNIDKREMAYSATRALLDAGHRRIGFFATASQPGGWNEQWLNGYRLALI
ncbi:MAG: LacI family DNA-binding transcriptional regulator, partial [bacterium]